MIIMAGLLVNQVHQATSRTNRAECRKEGVTRSLNQAAEALNDVTVQLGTIQGRIAAAEEEAAAGDGGVLPTRQLQAADDGSAIVDGGR